MLDFAHTLSIQTRILRRLCHSSEPDPYAEGLATPLGTLHDCVHVNNTHSLRPLFPTSGGPGGGENVNLYRV